MHTGFLLIITKLFLLCLIYATCIFKRELSTICPPLKHVPLDYNINTNPKHSISSDYRVRDDGLLVLGVNSLVPASDTFNCKGYDGLGGPSYFGPGGTVGDCPSVCEQNREELP